MEKPYSEACDQNKGPILAVLGPLLRDAARVLEVGSGTGQHAVHFAAALPHLTWQTSDVLANLPGIRLWLAEARLPNLPPPLALDVRGDWPAGPFDGVFSANTAHIMGEPEVAAMFQGVSQVLDAGGCFALYGPFRLSGRHTSESNAQFDAWLRARDPRMGVRDLEDLRHLGERNGLRLVDDVPMPVNNRTLIWERVGSGEWQGPLRGCLLSS
jgi:cyclopropane fatty-acyl-phospholipid synthase-like methyltransferase